MSDDIKILLICIIAVLTFSALVTGGIYIHSVMKYENFQVTIGDLNNEQKCLHICGFQYPSTTYFDQYKFCVEKCDRISERHMKCGE